MKTETKKPPGWSAELPELLAASIRRTMSDLIYGVADRVRGEAQASPDPDPDPVATDDDPATPENRRELARRMLVGAIARYEEANREWSAIDDSFPPLDPPRAPLDRDEYAERQRWLSLKAQAQESFNLAEMNLAERIRALFDMLAPAGRRTCDEPTAYFVTRAVRHQGTIYVLAYDPFNFEPETNVVATYRESLVIDLAGDPGREVV